MRRGPGKVPEHVETGSTTAHPSHPAIFRHFRTHLRFPAGPHKNFDFSAAKTVRFFWVPDRIITTFPWARNGLESLSPHSPHLINQISRVSAHLHHLQSKSNLRALRRTFFECKSAQRRLRTQPTHRIFFLSRVMISMAMSTLSAS